MAYSLDMTAQSHTVDLPAGRFHYRSWGAERSERPPSVVAPFASLFSSNGWFVCRLFG
jgi:hypothetical protein